ncbi:MAG: hypothetical protein UX68_C0018G0005 [Parcubacteria group bacterium GW2011_GWA2_46_9]|nr:MAG: hypothetical protein UX68_C0018G0005 [Parcubacteria group bacterium GW2011_GWA2_46_9]
MSGGAIWSLSRDQSAWHIVDTSPPPRKQVSAANDRTFQNDIYNFRVTVPAGWYFHERLDGIAILTKKERQPIPKDTETWSIGEQIIITVADMAASVGKNSSPEKWVAKNIPSKDAYDKPVKKSWEEINGNRLLKVEQTAAGTSNHFLAYYAFKENNVYSFTLYPYNVDEESLRVNLSDFETMVGSLSFVGLTDKK